MGNKAIKGTSPILKNGNNHPKGKSKIAMKQAKEEIDRASAFEKLFPPRGFTIKRQSLFKKKKNEQD